MKKQKLVLLGVLLIVFLADAQQKKTKENVVAGFKAHNEIITVNVTKQYPKKEFKLKDFADIEYIPLETTDEFLCSPASPDYMDESIILILNRKEGEILIYNRQGKALKKIKRLGQGGEEYSKLNDITYDKQRKEIYVNDRQLQKVFVYDLNGKYLRSFHHQKGIMYIKIENFDKDMLICYSASHSEGHPFLVISKQNGAKVRDLIIPYKQRVDMDYRYPLEGGGVQSISTPIYPIVRDGKNILLNEISSDTIYRLDSNFKLVPVFAQVPSNQQSQSNPIFLFSHIGTDKYQLMFTIKKEFDRKTNKGFPRIPLMYDKQKKEIYEATFYDDDPNDSYSIISGEFEIGSGERGAIIPIRPYRLIEKYKSGKLTGKLKEIVSKIKDDDNPVLMVIKFR
jgi:hypothetical protein